MSTPLVYYKPISLADRLLIDTVCHRYEGVTTPFVKFEDDEKVTLVVPADIRRVSYGPKTETQTNETPAVSTAANGRL